MDLELKDYISRYNDEIDDLIEKLKSIKMDSYTTPRIQKLISIKEEIAPLFSKSTKNKLEKSWNDIYETYALDNYAYRVSHDPYYFSIIDRNPKQ